jgi:hypothetical protein
VPAEVISTVINPSSGIDVVIKDVGNDAVTLDNSLASILNLFVAFSIEVPFNLISHTTDPDEEAVDKVALGVADNAIGVGALKDILALLTVTLLVSSVTAIIVTAPEDTVAVEDEAVPVTLVEGICVQANVVPEFANTLYRKLVVGLYHSSPGIPIGG